VRELRRRVALILRSLLLNQDIFGQNWKNWLQSTNVIPILRIPVKWRFWMNSKKWKACFPWGIGAMSCLTGELPKGQEKKICWILLSRKLSKKAGWNSPLPCGWNGIWKATLKAIYAKELLDYLKKMTLKTQVQNSAPLKVYIGRHDGPRSTFPFLRPHTL